MTARTLSRVTLLMLCLVLLAGDAQDAGPRLKAKEFAGTDLDSLIEDVAGATAVRFDAHDSAGHSMDTAKIIANPGGGYLSVYHQWNGSFFEVHLAVSTDLLHWTYKQSYGPHTHQADLVATTDGGFILTNEADNGQFNWIEIRYFKDLASLLSNSPAKRIDLPHTQVPANRFAEGTANIFSVTLAPDIEHSRIEIGFHYWLDGTVDRQARGVLVDFGQWQSWRDLETDAALLSFGLQGNVGDRDLIVYQSVPYTIHEGQFKRDDFGSWRAFLRNERTGAVEELHIRTAGGSTAFANSTATLVPSPLHAGQQALVVTHFIPHEGSAQGESGEVIYYHELEGSTQ